MANDDPFLTSAVARAATHRLGLAAVLLVALWCAVIWAVALP